MYPIEKGIPMPSPDHTKRARRFPLKEMQAGDSFLVPTKEINKHLYQAVRNCAKYYGKKVSVRKVSNGVRVWLVQ